MAAGSRYFKTEPGAGGALIRQMVDEGLRKYAAFIGFEKFFQKNI